MRITKYTYIAVCDALVKKLLCQRGLEDDKH